MANYMADVAKMLGVEIGEIFEINKCNWSYVLCYDGMICTEGGYMANGILNDLLTGRLTIKRKPWKPQMHDVFWYVDEQGEAVRCILGLCCCKCGKNFYKIGNCYKTREEAEANRDKWVSFYASDEVLEV